MKKYHLKRYPHIFYYHKKGHKLYGFRITKQINGVRHDYKKQGLKSLKLALQNLHELLGDKPDNSLRDKRKMSFRQWSKDIYHVRNLQWKPSTAANFKRICKNNLNPYIGNYRLNKITPFVYRNKVLNPLTRKGFRKSSLMTIQNVASELLNAAVNEKLISSNPLHNLRVHQGRPKQKKCLMSKSEFQQFLKSLKKEPWPSRFLFMLLSLTGMRMGEALGLKWTDFDNNYHTLHINSTRDSRGRRPPKTPQSRRTLQLPNLLSNLAQGYHRAQCLKLPSQANSNNYTIVDHNGCPLTSGDVSRRLKACLINAGLSKLCGHFTAHTFRHQFASYTIASGVPIAEVSHVLGHANPAITLKVYTQMIPSKHTNNLGQQIINKLS